MRHVLTRIANLPVYKDWVDHVIALDVSQNRARMRGLFHTMDVYSLVINNTSRALQHINALLLLLRTES